MAYRLLYTEDSLADLQAVLGYIQRDNPDAAERFGAALLDHVAQLAEFPRLGSPVTSRPGIRKLLHSPIRVYYTIDERKRQVEILHFWHGARRPPEL